MSLPTLKIDDMSLIELKDIMKMLVRLANLDHDIIQTMQARILEIEKQLLELKR